MFEQQPVQGVSVMSQGSAARRIVDQVERLGLALPAAAEWLARADEIRRLSGTGGVVDDLAQTRGQVIEQLAEGGMAAADAATMLLSAQSRASAGEAARGLLRAGVGVAEARAWGEVKAGAPGLLPRLHRLVQGDVRTAGGLADRLGPVTTDTDAIAGGARIAAAWAELTEIAARWEKVRRLVAELLLDAIVPNAVSDRWNTRIVVADYLFARPELVHPRDWYASPAPLRLARFAEAEPGVYAAEQVRARTTASAA